jgi:DNA-binding PadR family transcriptional regulator
MIRQGDPVGPLTHLFEGDVIIRYSDPGPEGPRRERRGHRRGEERRRGDGPGGSRGGRREHGHVHGGFGPDFGFGPFGGPRGRGRAGRGDVRAAIVSLLSEGPRNGYQIIQEINERTGGLWRVSSGSVYPTISQLEDEGLVEPADGSGRKLLALSQAGREYAEQNAGQLARLWEAGTEDARFGEFLQYRELMRQLGVATMQVSEVGTQPQREEAKQLLVRARQSMYKLLADEAGDAAEPRDGK